MASSKSPRQYTSPFAMMHGVLDLDDLILDEMLEASDMNCDPLLTPWRRGHRIAIRSAFSH